MLEVLFHPQPAPDYPKTPDLQIEVTDNVALGASLFPAEPSAAVVLLFHGNGELAAEYDVVAPAYNDLGLSLVVVDYRGYGFSQGTPSASALLHDARAVFHTLPPLLEELDIQADRLFVMGRSLGSAAAIEIAATVRHRLSGLILESGFAYTFPLIQRLGGPVLTKADERRDGFGHLDKMQHVDVPTLVIHGEEDHLIPVTDGMALHRHAESHRKALLTLPGAGHNDLLATDASAYFDAVARLVETA